MSQKWVIRAYYADDVKPPKTPGELAIDIWGDSREALSADIKALEKREDIGDVYGPYCATKL